MNKSMISIVAELNAKGHHVDYYVRKDGGILIKRIDNETFAGAKGNARARQLVGAELSEARSAQLKYATRVRMHPVKVKLTQRVKEAFSKVKKLWNKVFKAKGGKPHTAGYFGKHRIEVTFREKGEEETLLLIAEAERYATGLAYTKNVQILAEFVRSASLQYESAELEDLAKDIINYAYAIKEEWIYPAYQELYKLNQGNDPKDIAQNVRKILRL